MQEWMMMLMMMEMIHDDMPYILFILASRIRPSKSSLSLSLSPSTLLFHSFPVCSNLPPYWSLSLSAFLKSQNFELHNIHGQDQTWKKGPGLLHHQGHHQSRSKYIFISLYLKNPEFSFQFQLLKTQDCLIFIKSSSEKPKISIFTYIDKLFVKPRFKISILSSENP
ncbi:hypothetical protein GBA52_011235 [Prunus armeniaca]|nr:hypothetical protein GBA52_011235 [Prunus armeniaca]